MEKSIFFLLLQGCVLKLALARLDLTLTSSHCGDYYDMEDIGESYLTYSGADLDKKECSIKFTNYHTYAKQTCVKPLGINLDCSTKVSYHRHLISEYLDPAKEFSCHNISYDEWCGPTRTNLLFIVFRTLGRISNDNIQLHVYLKDLPKEKNSWDTDSDSSSVIIVVPIVCMVVGIVVMVVIIIACRRAQAQRSLPRTPYAVTSGPMNTQTAPGNTSSPQPVYGYQPPQQYQPQPPAQGGYQMHPMQSAYPMQQQQQQGYTPVPGYQPVPQGDIGHQNPTGIQQPSAPPPNVTDAPPSYESLTK